MKRTRTKKVLMAMALAVLVTSVTGCYYYDRDYYRRDYAYGRDNYWRNRYDRQRDREDYWYYRHGRYRDRDDYWRDRYASSRFGNRDRFGDHNSSTD